MGAEERITTTERHAELREAAKQALFDVTHGEDCPAVFGVTAADWEVEAEAVVAAIEPLVRVRVVEGLVATIKALPTSPSQTYLLRADVLAVVEAAREDTPDA